MADNSEISWTKHTANLWWGCMKVHAGCDNCYAETLSHRWGNAVWGAKAPRRAIKAVWKDLARYQREAAATGEIHNVFVGSMMDIFEKPFPLIDAEGNPLEGDTGQLRQRFFDEVVPNSPNLLFLLLTKRPGNILKYIPEAWKTNPPANVMYGTSVVNQETADDMIPKLLKVPGRRFLSMEPLLGSTDIKQYLTKDYERDSAWGKGYKIVTEQEINWVIVGGESGPKARPMHPDWALNLRNQCEDAGVPFHFKQWGEWHEVYDEQKDQTPGNILLDWDGKTVAAGTVPTDRIWFEFGSGCEATVATMRRVGKAEAGRLLDGKLHDAMPARTTFNSTANG